MRVVVFGRENDNYFEEVKRLAETYDCDNGNELKFQDVDLVFDYYFDLGIIVGKEASDALSVRLMPALKNRSICLLEKNELVDSSYTHQLTCENNLVLVLSELLNIFCKDALISIELEDFLGTVNKNAFCIICESSVENISFDNYRRNNMHVEVVLMRGDLTLGEVGELYSKIAKEDAPVWGYQHSFGDEVSALTVWSR